MQVVIRFAVVAAALLGISATQAADVLLILDGSNSMWGQIDGKNKIVIAREAVAGLVADVPDKTGIGLIAYGHRREGDCEDIELLSEIASGQRDAIVDAVNSVRPTGKTPITAALSAAFDVVNEHEGPITVILVSDGLETCNRDPCELVKSRLEPARGTLLHVVGFDVGDDVGQLACAAKAGGGLFLSADNAEQLASALERASELSAEEIPPERLVVRVIADGKLVDAGVFVYDERGEEVYFGRTYFDAPTNPHSIPLDPGTYRVEVRALGLSTRVTQNFAGIVIPDDESVVEREADFTTGILLVGVTRNGERSDAVVNITKPGAVESIASGRTYTGETSNPASYRILPGTYDVTISPLEFKGANKRVIENVAVEAGGETRIDETFDSGTLRVGVTRNGERSDAVVNIVRAGTSESVTGGRTYTSESNNPAKYELLPATYDVVITSTELKGAGKQRRENIVVKVGEEIRIDFALASGTLTIGAKQGADLIDALVSIVDAETGKSVAGGRTYTSDKNNPASYLVLPGTYNVSVRPTDGSLETKMLEGIIVKAGGDTRRIFDFFAQ